MLSKTARTSALACGPKMATSATSVYGRTSERNNFVKVPLRIDSAAELQRLRFDGSDTMPDYVEVGSPSECARLTGNRNSCF